ncbi:hypothetical protein [Actinomadura napierensis]|uniref:Mce-associated membrane protein n=1 Tax=Actinomadura napierensis TaxID=267854 RepID=A0ABN2YQH0_9ACTN
MKTETTEDIRSPAAEEKDAEPATAEKKDEPAADEKAADSASAEETEKTEDGEAEAQHDDPGESAAKDATAEADAPENRPSWRSRMLGLLTGQITAKLLVAAVLIASIVTAGLQWHRADKADTRADERRQVGDSAGRFGQALLSYDHTRLQAARNTVLSLASDDFAKTYDQAFTGGLEGIITKLKADASATVRTVYVGDVDGSNARAVVVMDSEVHSTAGTRNVLGSYLDMKLARSHGTWKVTEVTSIGAANESMTDPDGKQQTTPTQPEPSPSPGG